MKSTSIRLFASIIAVLTLASCAPATLRSDAIAHDVKTYNWKANMVFSRNLGVENTNTPLGAALQQVLQNVGWYASQSNTNYLISFERVAVSNPKKFVPGSEGSLGIRYMLKDRYKNLIWSGVVYSSQKMNFGESLNGDSGLASVMEKVANENLRQFFAVLEPVGAKLYDEQQSQITEDKLVVAFNKYDLFSDVSFFDMKPYSEASIAARNKLLKDTKATWMKKLRGSSAQNCLKFLDTYRIYLDSDCRAEVSLIIQQKMSHSARTNENSKSKPQSKEQTHPNKEPSQPKKETVEHKNPF